MSMTLRVGSITAEPGALSTGVLPVADLRDGVGSVGIPLVLMNGTGDGPTVYLHCGSHGQEAVTGIELIRVLTRQLISPTRLRGRLICAPVANTLAHEAAWRVSPVLAAREHIPYPGDPQRNFPGDPHGSLTQRLCHTIWQKIVLQSDVVLDYHVIASPGMAFVLVYEGSTKSVRGSAAWEKSVQLARAFGTTIIEFPVRSGGFQGACLEHGIPAIVPEVWDARALNDRQLGVFVRGTLNVLKFLEMIDGAPERHENFPILDGLHRSLGAIRANRGGVIHYDKVPGVKVERGEVIARIYNAFGELNEEVRMPSDGYIQCYPAVSWAGLQSVLPGDYIADILE